MDAAAHAGSLRAMQQDRPAGRDTIVHVFTGSTTTVATPAQIEEAVQLAGAGWPSTMILPASGAWSPAAQTCAAAGLSVRRTAPMPAHDVTALRYGVRMRAALRAWLAGSGAAVVCAHDDVAVLVWGPAARVSGLPVVWNVDVDGAAAALDRVRLAATSYLVMTGQGDRLRTSRRLPPHHRRARRQTDVRRLEQAVEQLTGCVATPRTPAAAPAVDLLPPVVDAGRPVEALR